MTRGIKTLNIYLTDAEHEKLYKLKRANNLTWNEMLLLSAKHLQGK